MGLIGPELAAWLEGGRAMLVATAAGGWPDATRGWGLAVGADGEGIRVGIAAGAAAALRNLAANDQVAVICVDVQTYRSVQLKGRAGTVTAPVALGDDEVWSVYLDRFFGACGEIGIPELMMRKLVPPARVTVEITVAELYDQTPGPAAGRPLTVEDAAT